MTEQALRERLRAIVEYKAAWKRDPSGQFERLAEQFYRETGLMAPGKSVPMEMAREQDDAARRSAWNAFMQRLSAERDATILEAADALAALSAPAQGEGELTPPVVCPCGSSDEPWHWPRRGICSVGEQMSVNKEDR